LPYFSSAAFDIFTYKHLRPLRCLCCDQTAEARTPQVKSCNSEVAKRLWNMLQDVGVSWEWKEDANWQLVATEHEELAEVMTAWPLLSPDPSDPI